MKWLVRTIIVAALLAAIPVSLAAALPPYPVPTPNFAHPGTPHNGDPIYGPAGGNDDRPLLVILVNFTDVAPMAGRDSAFFQNMIFGGFPSLKGYFHANSFGHFVITPAAETQGTPNDGVVLVDHLDTHASFVGLTEQAQNRRTIELADPFVNFADFDANGDGNITDDELILLVIREANPSPTNPENCGATRGIAAAAANDAKNVVAQMAMGTMITNPITHIHEVGHMALHMRDLYGFGVGAFDISGPTCGAPDNTFFSTSAWQKLHWGWLEPTVVVQDGYYTVNRADTSSEAFILYDPDKGTNDYFLVENRQQTPNFYDQSASDSGLVIWRIDDSQYNSAVQTVRPIDIMRPDGTSTGVCDANGVCYGGQDIDAWNPADPNTPQRTMSRTWRDGSASKVAVRAIPVSTTAMRVYFDVRGPGIMVDPTTAAGATLQINVTPEESNAVSFPVMNTGEATDTFNFTITGLPAGWTASTQTMTLNAGQSATATVQVTPDANAPVQVFTATAVGTSTTNGAITSNAPINLNVVLHVTTIAYTGLLSAPWGQPSGFSAQLTDATNPSEIISGAAVTFGINTVPIFTAMATSDSTGHAASNAILPAQPGAYLAVATVARKGKHAPALVLLSYTIEKRGTTLVYTGSLTADYSDPAILSGTLTDTISGAPLSGRSVDFALGTQSASGPTNGLGSASSVIVITQPSGAVTASAAFAGDSLYKESSDSKAFTITKETLSFTYTGDTLVALGTTPTLRALAVEEADGSPGNLALGAARFALAPMLSAVPFEYTTGLTAAGVATTLAAVLPVDLWTISIDVPATNQYYEGVSATPAELVLYDPAAKLNGGAHGDAPGGRLQLTINGQYQKGAAKGSLQLKGGPGRFKGDGYDWIVVVSGKAIAQMRGDLDGTTTVLRIRLADNGEPGRTDTFHAVLRSLAGALIYDSGVVTAEGGNLQIRP